MGVVGAIMLLNLGAMLGAHLFMERIGAPSLLVLGAVFGVLQAAMAVEMIISGLTLSRLMAELSLPRRLFLLMRPMGGRPRSTE